MIQDITTNKTDYSILALFSTIFIMYFLRYKSDPRALVTATLIFGALYVAWGIWHHARSHSITRHIVLEYFLVSILGIVIVSSLLI